MSNLPPLQLVDGAILLDNSSLEYLQTCPRSFEYHWLRKRISSADKAALNFGAGLHIGLATRAKLYGSGQVPDTDVAINASMQTWFTDHPQPLDDYRSLDYAIEAMRGYNKLYRNESWKLKLVAGKPLVEASFMHELGKVQNIPVFYTGRVDLLVTDSLGDWVVDHKTSSQFGDSFMFEMQVSAQMIGYCWAFQQTYGHKPCGYIVDAIRTRPPTKEEKMLLSYGGKPEFRKDNYYRLPWHVTQEQIDEWKADTLAQVATAVWHHDSGIFPRHKKWCVGKYGKCQYYDTCTLPVEQRLEHLASNSFMDNEWSPLNKPQQKGNE